MGSRLESNSNATRKRIANHNFENEEGEEYEPSKFGGFPEYFRRKKIKLQNLDAELRAKSAENPPIFRGIVAHINGYTQPSLNDLHTLIVSHGGGFLQYLDGKTQVTHIIASNLTPKKAEEFKKYRIVKPAWIVDSVAAGQLLPWDAYRVVDEGVGQKIFQFDNGRVTSQRNEPTKGYRDQSDASWYTAQLNAKSDEVYPDGQKKNDDVDIEDEYLDPLSQSDHGSDSSSGDQDSINGEANSSDHVQMRAIMQERSLFLDGSSSPVKPFTKRQDVDETDSSELYGLSQQDTDEADKVLTELGTSKQNTVALDALQQNVLDQDEDLQYFIRPASPHGRDRNSPQIIRTRQSNSESPSKGAKLTAEEHNAILLADPRIRKSTVVNPDFLEQYYRESRLHHLSTWKANLKSQLQKMTADKTASQKARAKRPLGARRYILHVDFDSFFVAVSLKKCPQFTDKPAVVAHGGGSGSEIASCNYPARKFGIKNGMWMKRAQDMCPDLKILPYDFPAYEEASRIFYDAVIDTGGVFQSVSIDEALIDVSNQCIAAGGHDGKQPREGSIYREQAEADRIAQNIRDRVLKEAGCAVSVGIGGNILLAKVALRKAKPAGQHQIKPEDVLNFIGQLDVQDLPGVAYSIGGKLEEIGVRYVKDIRELTKEKLVTTLGPKTGEKLWDYSRGIDKTEVGDQVIRKSVSAEVNWGVRFETQEQAEEFIESLCGELHKRLVTEQVKGRQFTMKIMRRAPDAPLDPPKHLGHGKCDTFNKSVALGTATNAQSVLTKEALSILRGYGFSPGELRGIGVQMTRLEPMKAAGDGALEGSQRRLQFKTMDTKSPVSAKAVDDPIQDDVRTPQKPRISPQDFRKINLPVGLEDSNSPSRKPLNVQGTQFVMPTAVDPEVLAELPEDIRSKLAKDVASDPNRAAGRPTAAVNKRKPIIDFLPAESQLDPDTLNALPASLRAEITSFYDNQHRSSRENSLLPQSPRKPRPGPPPKRGRGRPRGSVSGPRGRGASKVGSSSTLTQAAFITARPRTADSNTDTEPAISEDFLAALPEDIRREVLADQKRERLKRTSGIDIGTTLRRVGKGNKNPFSKKTDALVEAARERRPRTIKLPPRPPDPTFTTAKLSALPDLRNAISAWWQEFREEGPYREDVDALVRYLRSVVVEEGDMAKAAGIVRWMGWVVEGKGDATAEASPEWKDALNSVEEGVQGALVGGRGVGRMEF
ncbi:MAG: deoxycytidyl transferase [Bogoriella megaspora]|nr:MAG: deoxycytidyl transferase [Bogoriella megaspora]